MKLEEIAPFGRSLDEYRKMFALSDSDLCKNILGVGDGPASFNAELALLDRTVVSVDPLYIFRREEIESQFYTIVDNIIAQVEATPDDWVWSYHTSPEQLKQTRLLVFQRFIADYEQGKAEGRYIVGELPKLAFTGEQFQIALCSHFLFLYSKHLDYAFHRAAVFEMLRVATEVRIFPLLTLMLERSPHLTPLIEELETTGFHVRIDKVGYELQRGGNEMLSITKRA